MVDSHVHFDYLLQDHELLPEIISGIEKCIQISNTAENLLWSRDFAIRNNKSGIYYTAGIHPLAETNDHSSIETLRTFVEQEVNSRNKKLLVGIGECGLDFSRNIDKENQIFLFEQHIEIARQYKLPLIVHCRNAFDQIYECIKNKNTSGVLHCFSGDIETAKRFLDEDYLISFAGNLTFKHSHLLHETAAFIPLNRMLLETDSPALSPMPVRGKINQPSNIIHIYEFLAKIKKLPFSKIEDIIFQNFNRFFGPLQ